MRTVAVKIVILGSQGVGKTSLVTRYETKDFVKNTSSTIGASFSNVDVIIDDAKVKMQIWDTAGQERFRSMAPMYYRGANAAFLVYDMTNYTTFTDVKEWVHELKCRADGELMIVLVGNKLDLTEERKVTRDTAGKYASSIGASFYETSALDNTGVQEMFYEVATNMLKRAKTNTDPNLRVYSSAESNNELEESHRGSTIQLSEATESDRGRPMGCC